MEDISTRSTSIELLRMTSSFLRKRTSKEGVLLGSNLTKSQLSTTLLPQKTKHPTNTSDRHPPHPKSSKAPAPQPHQPTQTTSRAPSWAKPSQSSCSNHPRPRSAPPLLRRSLGGRQRRRRGGGFSKTKGPKARRVFVKIRKTREESLFEGRLKGVCVGFKKIKPYRIQKNPQKSPKNSRKTL